MNDRKINYYDFISSMQNADCSKGSLRLEPNIDIELISELVGHVPYISDLQKDFYKTYIAARYEKILLPAYKKII